jgi:hypothetical protein
MNEQIRPDHLERAAYVYVRPSSLHQVRHHREGNNGSTASPIGPNIWGSHAWS